MAITETSAVFDGTEIELRIDDLEVVSGGVEVSFGHQKLDFQGDDVELEWAVYVDGQVAATPMPFTPPTAFAQDRATVNAGAGDEITVSVSGAGKSESLSATVPTPFDPSNVRVESCSVPSGAVEPGSDVTVTATVVNDNSSSGSVAVRASAADATAEEEVELDANGSADVEFVFAFDSPGEYEPVVEVA